MSSGPPNTVLLGGLDDVEPDGFEGSQGFGSAAGRQAYGGVAFDALSEGMPQAHMA